MRSKSSPFGLFLLSAVFVSVSPVIAVTTGTYGNLRYSSDGVSVTITGLSGTATSIDFPAEIEGLPVRTIDSLGGSLFGGPKSKITTATIPEGVTTIGASAFRNCVLLQNITLPVSLTNLGEQAFGGCSALSSATLLGNIISLNLTFSGCTSLATVNLPGGITTLTNTFNGCTSLTSIRLPGTVTSIVGAFSGCTALSQIELPAGLIVVGDSAFSQCSSLQNIDFLPDSVVSIGDEAFRNCTGLNSLDFPTSLTSIGINAFDGCTGLTGLVVPETITVIGDGAFWGCANLASFQIPDRFLASLSNLGLDYKAELATNALVTGIANKLANNDEFITKLANEIISKSGHYGLATQAEIDDIASQTPKAVRKVLDQVATEPPKALAITSDLKSTDLEKNQMMHYQITTTFSAAAFTADGLPPGLSISSSNGSISGKPTTSGSYRVFLTAGIPGGGVVTAVKRFNVGTDRRP